jgi:hypothetical protein
MIRIFSLIQAYTYIEVKGYSGAQATMHTYIVVQGSIVPTGGSTRLQSVVMTVVGEKQCERSYFSVDITPQSMVRPPSHGPSHSQVAGSTTLFFQHAMESTRGVKPLYRLVVLKRSDGLVCLHQICAMDLSQSSAVCRGDSGGPLMLPGGSRVIGVVTAGPGTHKTHHICIGVQSRAWWRGGCARASALFVT